MARILAQARFIVGGAGADVRRGGAAPVSAQTQTPTAAQSDRFRGERRQVAAATAHYRRPRFHSRQESGNLEQPAGRDWREFHQKTLPGSPPSPSSACLAALVIFYLTRGMVKIEKGTFGPHGGALQRPGAFRALDDGNLLHHSCALWPQHHLRQVAAGADIRAGRLRRLVAVGQVRAQLPQLPVHHRRRADPADVDRRQHPEQDRRGMGQARRRHRRQRPSAGAAASTPARS